MEPDRPLVTFGVLSAAPYASRREMIRQTWRCFVEVRSGVALVPFVVGITARSDGAPLHAEMRAHADLVLLQTGVPMTRAWSPLHTTFLWFRHAVSVAPYAASSYVAKIDDDAFINVPVVVDHLRALLDRSHVYYGRFWHAAWEPANYTVSTAGRNAGEVYAKVGRGCLSSGQCHGPYPFTSGTMQLLSHALALALASSPAAVADIERSRALVDRGTSAPNFKALEDAWAGYAIYRLLGTDGRDARGPNVTITHASPHYSNVHDDWGFVMHNFTVFVHWHRKGWTSAEFDLLAAKVHTAYRYAQEHGCGWNTSRDTLACSPTRRGAQACTFTPRNRSCRVSATATRISGSSVVTQNESNRAFNAKTCAP